MRSIIEILKYLGLPIALPATLMTGAFWAASLPGRADRRTPIVTYCGCTECTASTSAAKQLKSLGYAEVYDFWGGLKSWVAMGLPIRGSEVAGK